MAGLLKTVYGHGSGFGYGNGQDDGSCIGNGSGYGYGSGKGVFSNYDYGEKIAEVDAHDVVVLFPWPYMQIGCQVHRNEYWRDSHDEIMGKNELIVSDDKIREIRTRREELFFNKET